LHMIRQHYRFRVHFDRFEQIRNNVGPHVDDELIACR
jgi:hypothetical protein